MQAGIGGRFALRGDVEGGEATDSDVQEALIESAEDGLYLDDRMKRQKA